MQKLDKKFDQFLINSKIPIRIATVKSNNVPVVISLWYVWIDEKIYCATKKTAKIVSYLQGSPMCGFEIAGDNLPYKGVRGEGYTKILQDKGAEILDILINKYLGAKESTLSKILRNNSATEVAIEITPEKIFSYDYTDRMKDV